MDKLDFLKNILQVLKGRSSYVKSDAKLKPQTRS